MKKLIAAGIAAGLLLAPAAAHAEGQGTYNSANRCTGDGWHGVSKVRAARGTTCATAHNVLGKWMRNDGLEGTVRLRVGRDGALWKCYGSRAYGKLNPWYISCSSSQGQWVSRYGGYFRYRQLFFQYRRQG